MMATLVKEIFIQFIDSNDNLFQRYPHRHTRNNVLPAIWASVSPLKLAHKISHHTEYTRFSITTRISSQTSVYCLFYGFGVIKEASTHKGWDSAFLTERKDAAQSASVVCISLPPDRASTRWGRAEILSWWGWPSAIEYTHIKAIQGSSPCS